IADAVKNTNRDAGGALLSLGQQSLAIRGSGLIETSEDLGSIVLDSQRNVPVFVRDIGRVGVGSLPQTGIFAMERQGRGTGGVEGIVLMRRGQNPSEVLAALHEAGEESHTTPLPAAAPTR